MALIYCRNCGNKISDQANFCPKCGQANAPLEQTTTQVTNTNETVKPVEGVQQIQELENKPKTNNSKKIVIIIIIVLIVVGAILAKQSKSSKYCGDWYAYKYWSTLKVSISEYLTLYSDGTCKFRGYYNTKEIANVDKSNCTWTVTATE